MIGLTNDYVESVGLKLINNFLGTFPCDIQPDVAKLDTFSLVFNESRHDDEGSHFVCVYATAKKIFYFDSMGMQLENDYIKMFVYSCNRRVVLCDTQVQSFESNFCGFFCLCFLIYMSRGFPHEKFYDCFSNDLKLNDMIVIEFIMRLVE